MYNSSMSKQKMRLPALLTNSHGQEACASLPESASLLGTVLHDTKSLLALMQRFGGCTVRIPKKWPPMSARKNRVKSKGPHVLCEVLTLEQMVKVVAHFGGTEVYIPKGSRYLGQMRNHEIIQSYSQATAQGVSSGYVVQTLAQRYGLSDRRIWDILKTTPRAHCERFCEDSQMCDIDNHKRIH